MRKSSKVLKILVALLVAMLPIMSNKVTVFADGSTTEITIFHTNDMHGSVANLSYVKTMKDQTKNSILVDAGDATQGSTLATYTTGMAIIELMEAAGYDLMTLGNHEFDYGSDRTIELVEAADFPVLSANTYKQDGSLLLDGINKDGSNGQYYIKVVDGVKIGFFGITTTETAYKTNPEKLNGVTFEDEVQVAKDMVAELKGKVDVIVGIIHVGIDETSSPTAHDIAKQVEGIDILIDGHSHSVDQTTENDTVIAQTGTKLANVGEIKIQVDTTTKEIKSIESKLLNTTEYTSYTPDATYASTYTGMLNNLAPILNEVVSNTPINIFTFDNNGTRVSRLEETPGGSLVADAMQERGSQIVRDLGFDYPVVTLQNGGGCRANILAGAITVGDILDVLPFGNMISIKEITPDVLYQALENGYAAVALTEEGYIDVALANGAFSQISGMRAVIDASQPVGSKVSAIYLVDEDGQEQLLSRDDTKTIIALVSNDFEIAGGDGYTMLKNLNPIAEGGLLDVVLQEYIVAHSVDEEFIYASTHGRIVVSQIEEVQNTGYLDIIPNIVLDANTEYEVTIDGKDVVTVTTDENGYFMLEQVTNGVHTISVDGYDYYVSSYTNIGLLSIEVVEKAVDEEPKIPDPEPTEPEPEVPNYIDNTPNTGDNTFAYGYIFLIIATGGCLLFIQKKNTFEQEQTDVN